MSTLRRAAETLAGSSTLRGAQRVAAFLGFGEAIPLDRASRVSLGIADDARRALIAENSGLLRCCIVAVTGDQSARLIAGRCAVRLAERSPHALWLVAVAQPATSTLILAVPPVAGTGRITALVVDTRRVQDSDAETVAAMRDALSSGGVMTHQRWRELLGRDALTRRFYRELEASVNELASSARGRAPDSARRELALLYTSRILFLAFLEAKGWLDGDREFLRHRFDDRCARGGRVHRRLLDPLFFGTLNTPLSRRAPAAHEFGRVPFLNGGLFGRAPVERRWRDTEFADTGIGRVVCDLLGRYRVTAREESLSWSEAAIDPEMLGRAFESLMASDDRRKSGAFFTPLPLIERVTTAAVDAWLGEKGVTPTVRRAALAGEPMDVTDRATILSLTSDIRVIDPACGSGAFLVHALERLADIRLAAGDARSTAARRREILIRSIFGIDVNPTAVWLCELRLWLSVVIDADERNVMDVPPLPNLDHNVRVGDALSGSGFGAIVSATPSHHVATLRRRYAGAVGTRKRALARSLDATERRIALSELDRRIVVLTAQRRDQLVALRGRDLFNRRIVATSAERARLAGLRASLGDARRMRMALRSGGALPFAFSTHFADVAARQGFDLVIGNPPWVRLHNITAAARATLAVRFRCWRDATWAPGARDAGTGRGFASQVDLAALFIERATQVARPGAAIGLLVPAKLWTSLSAGGIRTVLLDTCELRAIEDWSESPSSFDAVVYPSLVLATRLYGNGRGSRDATASRSRTQASAGPRHPAATVRAVVHRRDGALGWDDNATALPLDDSGGAPWLIIPPDARTAWSILAERGVPLARSVFGRPLLGVKTGCNDAFIVTPRPGWREAALSRYQTWHVRQQDREDDIELSALRPVLRGEHLRQWQPPQTDTAIIWTHGVDGAALDRLPRLAASWLSPWRRRLESRTDAVRAKRFWTLFRTEAADSRLPRVVWSDISRVPRAAVLESHDLTVPLNSCYVVIAPTTGDAHALATLLNSAPVAAWLCALAEPARGGYRRFLGWTLARLPLPRDWPRAVELLAPIGAAARSGQPADPHTVALAVSRAYGVRLSRLEPLLTWCLR